MLPLFEAASPFSPRVKLLDFAADVPHLKMATQQTTLSLRMTDAPRSRKCQFG
jgi:hypothetical protein